MSPGTGRFRPAETDSLGLAVGSAVVVGALSVAVPFLSAVTGTLGALAVATWAMFRSRASSHIRELFTGARAIALGSLGAGAGLYLAGPSALAPARGLLLGASLVPLWWWERRATVGHPRAGSLR